MKKHTPEPWVASKVMNFSGTLVSFINSETTTIFQTRQSDDEASIEEVQANADIAAAAPELLEALLMLMDVYESKGQLLSFNVDIARQAIKKATP